MLTLKELSFSGIGRFVDKQVINFDTLGKIVQVDGKNLNTGGSSGSGKSTVFHALDYLLGVNEIPATALQSRVTKDGINVSAKFIINEKNIVISRSKKDGLTIEVDGESVSGNSKIAEEKLDEIIGINRKLFKKMFHKKQKEGGFFLNLTAKESYDFLISVLGLEEWSKKIDKIDEDIKKITLNLNELNNKKSVVFDKNTQLRYGIVTEPPKPEWNEEEEKEALEKLEVVKKNIQKLSDTQENLKKSIIAPIIKTPDYTQFNRIKEAEYELTKLNEDKAVIMAAHNEKIFKVETAIKNLNSELFTINTHKKTVEMLKIKSKELNDQKKHIEDNSCPTCSQIWVGNSAADKLNQISSSIVDSAKKIESLLLEISKEQEINLNLSRAQDILNKLRSTNASSEVDVKILQIKQEIAELNSVKANLDKTINLENSLAQSEYIGKLSAIDKEYNELIRLENDLINNLNKIISTQQSLKQMDFIKLKNFKDNLQRIAEMEQLNQKELENIQNNIEALSRKSLIAEESKRLIKSYTLQVFQDTLDYIGNKSTDILSGIPNMTGATIYFESSKETKNGTIKEEVNAVVNLDGEGNIPIKTLSGGERTAIDLAVDLAVIDMIEDKAGKGLNIFILDEPFDGLDSVNKTQCLELLKNIDTNKSIVLVDHSSELKEMMSEVVTVIRNGEESSVSMV
jgi:DNA repair exonuclease SbcCD ATPase subunit